MEKKLALDLRKQGMRFGLIDLCPSVQSVRNQNDLRRVLCARFVSFVTKKLETENRSQRSQRTTKNTMISITCTLWH